MESLISTLEREWKQETVKPTELRLDDLRELLYTTLLDVLAAGKPKWQHCDMVYHTIEQCFSLGPFQLGVSFRFELSLLKNLRRKINFVELNVGKVVRFDMRKQNIVGSLLVRYCDDDVLVLEGNKGSVSVLKVVNREMP